MTIYNKSVTPKYLFSFIVSPFLAYLFPVDLHMPRNRLEVFLERKRFYLSSPEIVGGENRRFETPSTLLVWSLWIGGQLDVGC